MVQDYERDFVMKTTRDRDVHFIRFWFTDVLGALKSFAVVSSELDDAFEQGMSFDGRYVPGFGEQPETELLAFPEASTFQILPWRPSENAVARMFCRIKNGDGTPFEGDSREVLIRMMARARKAGFECNAGPELEYFYFKDDTCKEPLDFGSSYDLTSLDSASDLRRDTVLTLEKMGIPVKYSHHERGASQHEIDLRHADVLSMADSMMTYKMVVKEIALEHGVYASFLPRPREGVPGNGMHMHISLTDLDGENAFFDADDPQGYSLSATAKQFIAGLLKYAPEFCLVTNPIVNSYKRILADGTAPAFITWGASNSSSIVRIPTHRRTEPDASHIIVANPDATANPYLTLSVLLAAGLAGIEEGLEVPAPFENRSHGTLTRETYAAADVKPLPETLGQALELFESSQLMKDTLGEFIHGYIVKSKRREWQEYLRMVSPWELEQYREIF